MKTLLLALTLLISTQTFADEGEGMFSTMAGVAISSSPFITTGTPSITSAEISKMSGMNLKVAKIIINDAQDYIQNGDMNVFLASRVSLIQQESPEMSAAEAVDVLLEMAEQFLNTH